MKNCFHRGDFLLPAGGMPEKWAVIACDQYTSDPAYWNRVRDFVGDNASTLHMILPEAELKPDNSEKIEAINAYMRARLTDGTFETFKNCYVYVERTLKSGAVRQGVVGIVDLEQYDYRVEVDAMIKATEKTVLERVPPRMAVRRNAEVEFSHVLMLCDDRKFSVIEPLAEMKNSLTKLYDFELMEGGGHIAGWLVSGSAGDSLDAAIAAYESEHIYLVGDGNHSLLSAKSCYEELKKTDPGKDWSNHPARYATVELENVLSPAMVFEPIYRIITQTNPEKLIRDLQAADSGNGYAIEWIVGDKKGSIGIDLLDNELPIGALQRFLDKWLAENQGQIDYIHDEDAVTEMASKPNAIGFLLSSMDKKALFPYITAGNLLSRKAFSLGHGAEKRYYLEGRKIR